MSGALSYEEQLQLWLGQQIASQLIDRWEHLERLSKTEVKNKAAKVLGDVTGLKFTF
jgi:hypothetical protein